MIQVLVGLLVGRTFGRDIVIGKAVGECVGKALLAMDGFKVGKRVSFVGSNVGMLLGSMKSDGTVKGTADGGKGTKI